MSPGVVTSLTSIVLQVDVVGAFEVALGVLSDPVNLFLVIIASLFGFLMGVIPGLGGVTALALLVPLTFDMSASVAFMILSAAYAGVNFGGSITAILLNTPGASPNAATVLDGYPMTRKGEAGRAIGASSTASALGAIVGLIILTLSIPLIREIILLFGPVEIFWMAVWGLTIVSVVIRGSVLSGLIAGAIGALLAMHGQNLQTANYRWTYDLTLLDSGVGLIPVLIGLFALTEMIKIIAERGGGGGGIARAEIKDVTTGRLEGIKDVFRHKWVFLRSSFIGTLVGVIPGVGGVLANFFAYFRTVQSSDDPDAFGEGEVRGVISSESSNDASANGGYLPTLGFGIPGSIAMVVILGAFVLQGIQPGPLVFRDNLDIVAVIILTSVIGNVVVSVFGLLTIRPLVKIAAIDVRYVAPVVIGTVLLASFAVSTNIFNVFITAFFGVFGYVLYKAEVSPIPIVLALVLTPIIERNYFRAVQIGRGDLGIFFESGIAKLLILFIVASLVLPVITNRTRGVFTDE